MARLLEAGQQNRGRYVRLADRAASLYVPAVHGTAVAVFVGGLAFGLEVQAALTNAIALLIITCPCALGLAVPAVQIVATSRLFRSGLLVKSGDALERLAEADVAVFDKTGTLTRGRPVLMNGESIARGDLELAASLASASKHPLSRALVEAAGPGAAAVNVHESAGEGLEAAVGGVPVRLGRAQWVGCEPSTDANASHLWLRKGKMPPVRFDFQDRIRPDAREVVGGLAARGLDVEMLSGDRDAPAEAIAREAGISHWRATSDPKQKAARLEELRSQDRRTLMVGDGLNDAAALALAHVSISPASAAHASQAAADMVLQGEALQPIVEAVDVARSARRRVFENFAFAAAYNLAAVPLAALGQVTPLIAAVAMSASSLIVMLNAFRLARRG
jgi:Cu2+-exporting ATPase